MPRQGANFLLMIPWPLRPSDLRRTATSIGSLHLGQDQVCEAKGALALATELLQDNLHNTTHKVYTKDGPPVDYSVRLELPHALLNLTYVQLTLKQW